MRLSHKINRSIKNPVKLRWRRIWTGLLAFILLICVYLGIFHSHRYFSFDLNLWTMMTGFLSIGIIESIWFNEFDKWNKLRSLFISAIFGLPILFFVIKMHHWYVENQLTVHGKKTIGIVTGFFNKKSKNSRTPYAIFTYEMNGKKWNQSFINYEKPLTVGDTLHIICSEKDPEVFERLEAYGKP